MAAHVAEVMKPLHAAALVGSQQFRGRRRGRRGTEDSLAPGLDLRGERQLEALVVEEGKNEVRGERGAVDDLGLLHVLLPGAVGFPALGRQRHDAQARENHRLAPSLQEGRDLGVGEHPLPRPEDPAQVEGPRVCARALGAFRDRLDLDGAGPLQKVDRLVVQLDHEGALPHRKDRLQEIRDLHQGLQQVGAGLLIVMVVGLAGVGCEPDQLRALARGNVPVAVGMGVGPQGRVAGLGACVLPVGLERKAGGLRLEDQDQRAGRAVDPARRHRRLARREGGCHGSQASAGGTGAKGSGREGAGALRNARDLLGKRRDFIGHELLDLVQTGHRESPGDVHVGRGRADRQALAGPLHDDILVLLVDSAVDDRVLVGELELADLAVPVNPSTLV